MLVHQWFIDLLHWDLNKMLVYHGLRPHHHELLEESQYVATLPGNEVCNYGHNSTLKQHGSSGFSQPSKFHTTSQ
jgi:hypothetical protein